MQDVLRANGIMTLAFGWAPGNPDTLCAGDTQALFSGGSPLDRRVMEG